jgi:hypothetical protein
MRRRDFLQAGALALPGAGFAQPGRAAARNADVSCIVLMLVGGPSHIDTWDMKPDAPADVRGPFRPIRTNVPGMEISEIFPRMARHADKYALIRSVYHTAPPFHDSGHQVMQTGRAFDDLEYPHIGSVLARVTGSSSAILPFRIGNTGGNMPHGQSAGYLGAEFEPALLTGHSFDLHHEPEGLRRSYGLNRFGQSCLMARRLVESGTRFVTVNMFETVFDETTWDIHGSAPFSPISCYRDYVGPMFDQAFSSLLQDLSGRGMLEKTLVVAMGEFGRTPKINPSGGRDHWPGCSTVLMAGGGVRGGQVYGSSDRTGSEPRDNPVDPAMIAATIYTALGVPLDLQLRTQDGRRIPVVESGALPIRSLMSL